MKSEAIQFVLAILAAASFLAPAKRETPPDLAKLAELRPDWDWADIAKRSPACDCEGKCECCDPCLCNVVDEEPLKVGPPPDVVSIANGQIVPVALVEEPKFTQPSPAAPKPAAKPQPVAKVAPTGHYETVYAGFRGRRSYQVWVPHTAGAACSSGGCASCGRGR
jgi:hypothetical protein